jgi:hypothetical protein
MHVYHSRERRTRASQGSFSLALLATIFMVSLPSTSHAGAMVQDPGCAANVLPRNDDEWVNTTLGFSIRLGDKNFTEIVVDNNGYVMFGAQPPPTMDYNRLRLDTTRFTIIAPFLADVDTRMVSSDEVTYGSITYNGHPAFCVNWGSPNGNGVDYFVTKDTKRNKFQLILVSRAGDLGSSDFDIVMNYDQVQWDFAYDQEMLPRADRSPTWVGFTPGIAAAIPGSGIHPGGLIDGQPNAARQGSRNSAYNGRYLFEIRNGVPPDVATVSGTFLAPDGLALKDAAVQLCRTDGKCFFAYTNAQGRYSVFIPVGELNGSPFTLTGSSPNPFWLFPSASIQVVPVAGGVIDGNDAAFTQPSTLPAGTVISPTPRYNAQGISLVNWQSPFSLYTVSSCPLSGPAPGTNLVRYSIFRGDTASGTPLRSGPMTQEGTTNTYKAELSPFFPEHGVITVSIRTFCKDGTVSTNNFNIYIDPSGEVRNANGNRILHARMTLYRSDDAQGPFAIVPDGSVIMSPANRVNPMLSDEQGHFGWDTLAGYYVVRAEKPGCTAVGRADLPYAETAVLPVPPPVTDIDLRLDCSAVPPPAISAPSSLGVEAQTGDGALVAYEASALDAADGPVPVSCVPASGTWLPMGTTTVTCRAMNSYGNVATTSFPVTVADTIPPVLTLPDTVAVPATSASGANVTYPASAVDGIDGNVQSSCSPPSNALFPPGETRVLCQAADAHGNTAQGLFPVQVTFEFGGFLPPLSPGNAPVVKRHQPIPVRFSLAGASAPISDLAARLFVARFEGGAVGSEVPAVSAGRGFPGNLFRPEGNHGVYHFPMSTAALDPGVYRLRIDLGDGTLRTVLVTIRN